MAKTTAPLLSFGASGQIGKTQVYSRWRGVLYARRHVIPANPRTTKQLQTRSVFSFLNEMYKLLPADAVLPWTAYAKGQKFLNRNGFFKKNLPAINGPSGTPHTTMAGLVGSPGAGGGSPPAALAPTDATGHVINASLTAPAVPAGWLITRAQTIAILDDDPHTTETGVSYYADDATPAYAPQIDVGAAGTYRVAAWFEYSKPDGSLAYGPSLNASVVIA